MRKQIGFDVISENIGGDVGKQQLLARVQQYLDAGWEVLNTHIPLVSGGAITITVVLVKWEDSVGWQGSVPVVSESETLTGEPKRGPGRPKKVEVNAPDVVPSSTA